MVINIFSYGEKYLVPWKKGITFEIKTNKQRKEASPQERIEYKNNLNKLWLQLNKILIPQSRYFFQQLLIKAKPLITSPKIFEVKKQSKGISSVRKANINIPPKHQQEKNYYSK